MDDLVAATLELMAASRADYPPVVQCAQSGFSLIYIYGTCYAHMCVCALCNIGTTRKSVVKFV